MNSWGTWSKQAAYTLPQTTKTKKNHKEQPHRHHEQKKEKALVGWFGVKIMLGKAIREGSGVRSHSNWRKGLPYNLESHRQLRKEKRETGPHEERGNTRRKGRG